MPEYDIPRRCPSRDPWSGRLRCSQPVALHGPECRFGGFRWPFGGKESVDTSPRSGNRRRLW